MRCKFCNEYLKEMVYGASDGIVSTFAAVAGAAGAQLSPLYIFIVGLANLLGDAVSMGAGVYLGTRSEKKLIASKRSDELESTIYKPDEEKEEIRRILRAKGVSESDLDEGVNFITKNRKLWVDMMIAFEHYLNDDVNESPRWAGFATFAAFIVAGIVPLISYVLGLFVPWIAMNSFEYSVLLTAFALFFVGALRSKFTESNWIKDGFEMLLIGGFAAFVAYGVGEIASYALRGGVL